MDHIVPPYDDFKIDYSSELDEILKLKVTTTALGVGTAVRTKLTEALRQKRTQIASVGGQNLRGKKVAYPTFDIKGDRGKELEELRRRGAARSQPWAEAHAFKMFSRRCTKNVLITQSPASASPTLAAKVVCDRLFSQPSKKKRVLERLTSQQMREIEATVERVKFSRRPLSEYLERHDENQEEFDGSLFQADSQWSTGDDLSDLKHHIQQDKPVVNSKDLSLLSEDKPKRDVDELPSVMTAAEKHTERTQSVVSHQSHLSFVEARSPSITSNPICEDDCAGPPDRAVHLTHSRSLDQAPSSSTKATAPLHHTLPPHILNDPGFVEYMKRTNMEPVSSTYISYKIAHIGDKIDERYADQISRALESVLVDEAETTKLSYDSFYRASHKLILEGASALDRMFILACFGRRILEGAPELGGIVKNYTHTVMAEWVSYAENYSDAEIARDYDIWDTNEYTEMEIFSEFPQSSIMRVESTDSRAMMSKCNSVEALVEHGKPSEEPDSQMDSQAAEFSLASGTAPPVISVGRHTSVSPNSSIRIVTPIIRTHKRSRSDFVSRTVALPVDPVPCPTGCEVEPNKDPTTPVRKRSSLQYVYDTAMYLSPAIVHTVCGILMYFVNKR